MFSMRDQNSTRGRRLKIVNIEKKRTIIPDVMLHVKNVMVPLTRPVPVRQSINVPFSANRPRILRAQHYKNNPALLFSETPSHTLYDPLDNLFEVKRVKYRKTKNQSMKRAITGKAASMSMKTAGTPQNSLRKVSRKGKDGNVLDSPNTAPACVKLSTNDKELQKASSKSIQLSRKCDLGMRMREGHLIRDTDVLAITPRVEMLIDDTDIASKSQAVSLSSESSFCNIMDTTSTVSTISVSSFKIENKKTFADIGNRKRSVTEITSNHLHSNNSEYELSVLHYENDPPIEEKFPSVPSRLNSPIRSLLPAQCSGSTQMSNDNESHSNKKNAVEKSYRKWDANDAVRGIKYSWEAVNTWIPPSLKRQYNNPYKMQNFRKNGWSYDCGIKYSWQVIGTGTQTSHSLLQDLMDQSAENRNKPTYNVCSVKYSWQIIGISTQASLHDYDPDYWNGVLLTPNKNYNEKDSRARIHETDYNTMLDRAKYPEKKLKRYIILNNQQTQTFAEKDVQVDCYAKYSWHSLIKRCL